MRIEIEISEDVFFAPRKIHAPRNRFNRRDRRAVIAFKHSWMNEGLHTIH